MKFTSFYFVLVLLFSTSSSSFFSQKNLFDWQGHRGARGLFPENSVLAFVNALKYPVTTLELDVVVSKDYQLVVSHEPWFSDEICEECPYENNLYRLNLDQIQSVDCGSKPHKRFLSQKKMITHKPTLTEVVEEVRNYCRTNDRNDVRFNIELKSKKNWQDIYVPNPNLFASIVIKEIKDLGLENSVTLQSFDSRVLEALHEKENKIKLVFLTENAFGFKKKLKSLSFTPYAYSPNYKYLKKCHVKKLHKKGLLVIPWTVNSKDVMIDLIKKGVDGIITDYPNLIEKI